MEKCLTGNFQWECPRRDFLQKMSEGNFQGEILRGNLQGRKSHVLVSRAMATDAPGTTKLR